MNQTVDLEEAVARAVEAALLVHTSTEMAAGPAGFAQAFELVYGDLLVRRCALAAVGIPISPEAKETVRAVLYSVMQAVQVLMREQMAAQTVTLVRLAERSGVSVDEAAEDLLALTQGGT